MTVNADLMTVHVMFLNTEILTVAMCFHIISDHLIGFVDIGLIWNDAVDHDQQHRSI